MRIERVDDKTVKCFLSNKELEEYEITYKDFVVRSDKAREVVEEIIEQAEEEVGYQPPRFAFDLQIMMLPDQGMILTFSEKGPEEGTNNDASESERLLDCLREMKEILEEKKKRMYQEKGGSAAVTDREADKKQKTVQEDYPAFAVFAFAGLGDLLDFAFILPGNLRVKSILYEMGGVYYLYLNRGRSSYERYSRICIRAMEFGKLYAADEQKVLYLEEHGQCLIAENALKKLRISKQNVKSL